MGCEVFLALVVALGINFESSLADPPLSLPQAATKLEGLLGITLSSGKDPTEALNTILKALGAVRKAREDRFSIVRPTPVNSVVCLPSQVPNQCCPTECYFESHRFRCRLPILRRFRNCHVAFYESWQPATQKAVKVDVVSDPSGFQDLVDLETTFSQLSQGSNATEISKLARRVYAVLILEQMQLEKQSTGNQ
jgi:hypothetical protein